MSFTADAVSLGLRLSPPPKRVDGRLGELELECDGGTDVLLEARAAVEADGCVSHIHRHRQCVREAERVRSWHRSEAHPERRRRRAGQHVDGHL